MVLKYNSRLSRNSTAIAEVYSIGAPRKTAYSQTSANYPHEGRRVGGFVVPEWMDERDEPVRQMTSLAC